MNMSTTTTMPRRHHSGLQPLTTSHNSAKSSARRASSTPSSIWTNTSRLPSPSVVAARAYFLEQSPPIGQTFDALQRRKSLIEGQEFPRRHSALPTPGGLATKIANFKVSSSDQNLEVVREIVESESSAKAEQGEDGSMTENKQNDLFKVTAIATTERTHAVPAPTPEFLHQVPFQYTHDRLRDWGFAYLGNVATADAFINAVTLRRPSLQLVTEDIAGDRPGQAGMVTIRARVLPKAKERKPFIIQRKFDVEELRSSIPAIQRPESTPLRRSNRARRSSTQISNTSLLRRMPESPGGNLSLLGTGAVPIREQLQSRLLLLLIFNRHRIRTPLSTGTCCAAAVWTRQEGRLHRSTCATS